MIDLATWWAEHDNDTPWLLLGKGPSFASRDHYPLQQYRVLGLNDVVVQQPVELLCAMDLETVERCGEAIEQRAAYLLMPYYPHRGIARCSDPLEHHIEHQPVLQRLDRAGRLIAFNYFDGAEPRQDSPVIARGRFSAEVMVNLLAAMGVETLHTLGVDGGTDYADHFDRSTCLANNHPNFDVQWEGISRTVRRHDIDYRPLTTELPLRIFVGVDESQRLGARVLEYSIRRYSPLPLIFDTMDHVQAPVPVDAQNRSRTEFSFNRFAIPALAGYRGRAVYLDADMQVFRNFQQLWDTPFDGASVLYAPSNDAQRPKQFSVMLLNCEALDWNLERIIHGLDAGSYDYRQLMAEMCIVPPEKQQPTLPMHWNSLEHYEAGVTGLIHYTDMRTQPWVSARNPNGDLWVSALRDALDEGFIAHHELDAAIDAGFARPSLRIQLQWPQTYWPLFNRLLAPLLDRRFNPHHRLIKRLKKQKKAH